MNYLVIVFLLILAPTAARSQQLDRSRSEDVAKEADLKRIRAERARVDLERGTPVGWEGYRPGSGVAKPNDRSKSKSRSGDPLSTVTSRYKIYVAMHNVRAEGVWGLP
jgi:hypothetical protein